MDKPGLSIDGFQCGEQSRASVFKYRQCSIDAICPYCIAGPSKDTPKVTTKTLHKHISHSSNMSHHNILITGGSGYLGGTVLAQLGSANLAPHGTIYALVRTDKQAEAVKQYGVKPLTFDTLDQAAVEENVVGRNITIVYWLIEAGNAIAQPHFIKALAKVKQATGHDVHFLHVSDYRARMRARAPGGWDEGSLSRLGFRPGPLALAIQIRPMQPHTAYRRRHLRPNMLTSLSWAQTTGAKIFSGHAGAPTERPLYDTDADLYAVQKAQAAPLVPMQKVMLPCSVVPSYGRAPVYYCRSHKLLRPPTPTTPLLNSQKSWAFAATFLHLALHVSDPDGSRGFVLSFSWLSVGVSSPAPSRAPRVFQRMQGLRALEHGTLLASERAGRSSRLMTLISIPSPCVDGQGLGFGNPISIQTVAVVKAAQAARRVYRVDEGRPVRYSARLPSLPFASIRPYFVPKWCRGGG